MICFKSLNSILYIDVCVCECVLSLKPKTLIERKRNYDALTLLESIHYSKFVSRKYRPQRTVASEEYPRNVSALF